MLRKRSGTVEWLEFALLAQFPKLSHGVFLRHGGVSSSPFSSLNLLSGVKGDSVANVAENRKRVAKALNLNQLISSNHLHGNKLVFVQKEDNVPPCDGYLTNQTNKPLMVTHADCQAAIFYDPVKNGVAIVHAGWRGQVKQIYRETVLKMQHHFHSKVEDLFVGISPSLGPNNAEFKNYRTELPSEFWPFQIKPLYFDLWAIARWQLIECGILPHHIEIAMIDTYACPEDFFSYRRDKSADPEGRIGCHGTVANLIN